MSVTKKFTKAFVLAIMASLFCCETVCVFCEAEPAYAAKRKNKKKKASPPPKNQQSANVSHHSVGDIFTFGKYEQDNNQSNGKEDIEWVVLAKENNRILVISKYVLDSQPYNNNGDKDWGNCSLRRWLNDTFMKSAFNTSEQSKIPTVKLENRTMNVASGEEFLKSSTQDKIFLLSRDDVYKYFASDSERQCKPTVYAKAKELYVNDDGFPFWWLRNFAVRDDGYPEYSYFDVHDYDAYFKDPSGVRPVMWLNI